jgi:hypothetical protein
MNSRKYSPSSDFHSPLRLNKTKSSLNRSNSFVLTKQIQKNYFQQQNHSRYEKLRLNIKKFFANTFLGQCYVNGLQFLTICSVIQFILQTYVENIHRVSEPRLSDYLSLFISFRSYI